MHKKTSLGIINLADIARIVPTTAKGDAKLIYSDGTEVSLSPEQLEEFTKILCKSKEDEIQELLPAVESLMKGYFEMLGIPYPMNFGQPQGQQDIKDPDRPEPEVKQEVKEEKKETKEPKDPKKVKKDDKEPTK